MSNKPKLIGTSFSVCIRHILLGWVSVEQIQQITVGVESDWTWTESDWIKVIQEYYEAGFWSEWEIEKVIEVYHQIKDLIHIQETGNTELTNSVRPKLHELGVARKRKEENKKQGESIQEEWFLGETRIFWLEMKG